tara:strand:+ start:912 stop:1358 length:447 start_codon:yes stop_codon:yes gene_type:complete
LANELAVYGGLFWTAFLASTVLPGASEIVLAGLILSKKAELMPLVVAATIGNTLGSITNWMCGRFLSHFIDRKWFPVSSANIERATDIFQRYGFWSLLFAWMPVVGDALTVLAGILRVRLFPFTVIVGIGKFVRYLFVAAVALGWAAS